ncbi:MAG: hypothetical protein M3Y72_21195 [Acidobacteriota bacterium]|nr:hypothetical protein [Acidobacteriota bacterium]
MCSAQSNFGLSGIGLGPQTTVTPGLISTFAGTGTYADGPSGRLATQSATGFPGHIASDAAGNIYFVDDSYGQIRRVDAKTGIMTVVAGNGASGYTGDGGSGHASGLSGRSMGPSGNLQIRGEIEDAGNRYGRTRVVAKDCIESVTNRSQLKEPVSESGETGRAMALDISEGAEHRRRTVSCSGNRDERSAASGEAFRGGPGETAESVSGPALARTPKETKSKNAAEVIRFAMVMSVLLVF